MSRNPVGGQIVKEGAGARTLYDSTRNRLLAALPEAELARLRPQLELVNLELGSVLREGEDRPTHIFFPTDCIVSVVYILEESGLPDIVVVGNEGVIGFPLFLGDGIAHSHTVVQHPGAAYRIRESVLQQAFCRTRGLQQVLLRYAQTLLAQTARTPICNRYHTVEQRLARWVLLMLDRVPTRMVHVTQEVVSEMLNACRQEITTAARRLHEAGTITYQRGRISVADRAHLEAHTCDCYQVVRREYDRLLNSLQYVQ